MTIKKLKDFQNDLTGRREIEIIVDADKTPSYVKASKIIADEFKEKEEDVLVEKVQGKFGRKTFLVKASAYKTKELRDEAEKRSKKPKKGAAPAAA